MLSQSMMLRKRFIPVCTGNASVLHSNELTPPVYPCVYRERINQINNNLCIRGLSLCIQGTLCPRYPFGINSRFIPVCTGNIRKLSCMRCNRTVYPCVYREHSCCFGIVLTSQRFIPVCTGNINSNGFSSVKPDGLSLCVQGTPECIHYLFLITRFIPVCTGNAPIITYCFIFKILTVKFLPIF